MRTNPEWLASAPCEDFRCIPGMRTIGFVLPYFNGACRTGAFSFYERAWPGITALELHQACCSNLSGGACATSRNDDWQTGERLRHADERGPASHTDNGGASVSFGMCGTLACIRKDVSGATVKVLPQSATTFATVLADQKTEVQGWEMSMIRPQATIN